MFSLRLKLVAVLFTLGAGALLARLAQLQVRDGEFYAELDRHERTWEAVAPAVRGRILDRRGELLACDRPAYDVAVVVERLPRPEFDAFQRQVALVERGLRDNPLQLNEERRALLRELQEFPFVAGLAAAAGRSPAELAEGLLAAVREVQRDPPRAFPWTEQVVLRDLEYERWVALKCSQEPPFDEAALPPRASRRQRNRAWAAACEAWGVRWPGIACTVSSFREYPLAAGRPLGRRCGAHVLGYLREYDPAEDRCLRRAGAALLDPAAAARDAGALLDDRPELRAALGALLGEQVARLPTDEARAFPWPETLPPPAGWLSPSPAPDAGAAVVELVEALHRLDAPRLERLRALAGERAAVVDRLLEQPALVRLSAAERAWLGGSRWRQLADARLGAAGIEQVDNERLRGRHGYQVLMRTFTRGGAPGGAGGGDGGADDGRGLAYLRETFPQPGGELRLTLDARLQAAAEEALLRGGDGHPGAVAALDPWTGEVLALASFPDFDPNALSRGELPEVWLDRETCQVVEAAGAPGAAGAARGLTLGDPEGRFVNAAPLLNRALAATYPMGSLFKIIDTSAGLESGKLDPQEMFNCDGALRLPGWNHHPRCSSRYGHGDVALETALEKSCNVYFFNVGLRVGIELLGEWGRRFGLGEPTGIDLPYEKPGVMPDRAWKRATFARIAAEQRARAAALEAGARELEAQAQALRARLAPPAATPAAGDEAERLALLRQTGELLRLAEQKRAAARDAAGWVRYYAESKAWSLGDTVNIAIGQGNLEVTPLQVAAAYAAIATDGRLPRPHVLLGAPAAPRRTLPLHERTLRELQAGLCAVTGRGGTASRAFGEWTPFRQEFPALQVAGKTGSAELGGRYRYRPTHAWFAGYAPAGPNDRPEIVVAVLVEQAGHGGEIAAPIAAEVLAAFFRLKQADAVQNPKSKIKNPPATGRAVR